MSYVRKLSLGPNFPDGAVHYQVDRPVLYNKEEKRKTHLITSILEERDDQTGITFFDIYIKNIPINEEEVVSTLLWKRVPQGIHTVVEYSIDFD